MTPRTPQTRWPRTESGRVYLSGSFADGVRRWGEGYSKHDVVLAIEDEARALPDPTEPRSRDALYGRTVRSFDGEASVPTPLPDKTPFSIGPTTRLGDERVDALIRAAEYAVKQLPYDSRAQDGLERALRGLSR